MEKNIILCDTNILIEFYKNHPKPCKQNTFEYERVRGGGTVIYTNLLLKYKK
jgi:predicted nucleic acid-binding protein